MTRRLVLRLGTLLVIAAAGLFLVVWFTCRIYVPENKCAVLIRKMGKPLGVDQLVATEPGQKGILWQVLGPGRHFRDPIRYDWELKDLTVIPSGQPSTWQSINRLDARQQDELRTGRVKFKGEFPQIGVVTRKIGKEPPPGQTMVKRDSGMRGILEEVLTPGTYKVNPYVYEVELHPAVVIPAGFVGVVTNLFGTQPLAEMSATLSELEMGGGPAAAEPPAGGDSAPLDQSATLGAAPPLANPGERGTLGDVLQPGVYFINPKLQKVTIIEIGFNEYSQVKISEAENYRISFPSDTGFLIRVGVTVVWGIHPRHAAEIINEFGNTDGVLDKVIGPQLRSICRNIGSTYGARDFIQGEKRELFQAELTKELQRICRKKNIEVLLALVREIEVLAPHGGGEGAEATEHGKQTLQEMRPAPSPRGVQVTEDLKRTIQESYIAIEKQLTKEKQRDAAMTKAQLQEVQKQVEIAREKVKADTRVKVATIQAEGDKQAAEVAARAALAVATTRKQVAELDARRTEILGQARADVEKMKKAAEAEGYRMLVAAFGSPQAYNLYTFAENFQPKSIKLFFAGDGTFWTDLSRFEEVGAAQLLEGGERKAPKAKPQ